MIAPRVRRLGLVAVALTLAGVILRPQVSSALVNRGDTLAYYGNRAAAQSAYAKALAFDAGNETAADRFVFGAVVSHRRSVLERALEVATRFLAAHPDDGVVLMDRAMCYQQLNAYERAAVDFRRTGLLLRDPRALLFAALDEGRLQHASRERRLLRAALAIDPGFLPVRRALGMQ